MNSGNAQEMKGSQELADVASAGYYVALRVGFAFPLEEVNRLPQDWVSFYTEARLVLFDPAMRWVYGNVGVVRWSALNMPDPQNVLGSAKEFGLNFGLSASVLDEAKNAQRSFGLFARSDREFTDAEAKFLLKHLRTLHKKSAPPSNLTDAELEALRMVKEGLRLKEIAYQLGVSEGAIKQRLKNARLKLGAQTGPQAVTLASTYGFI